MLSRHSGKICISSFTINGEHPPKNLSIKVCSHRVCWILLFKPCLKVLETKVQTVTLTISVSVCDSFEALASCLIKCFHMTSRRSYGCPKTMKRRPCCCPKPILWELNSFLMQTLSFVQINLLRYWPREWKHSIAYGGLLPWQTRVW